MPEDISSVSSVLRGNATKALLVLILAAVGAMLLAFWRDPTALDHPAFGAVLPLALLAGFIGLYLRARPRDPRDIDEEEQRRRFRMTVIKLGCLVFATALVGSVVLELVLHWMEPLLR